ncbi:YkgJ family cysteine cluster protein [Arenimonas sp. MALMAid1274]|uniref:YkgJ family cysteine cluster protein n=1 Tax=Arenimonas sp. MALMAid1274 TaxID=3411630 RepID=UPI003BA0FD17
MRDHPCLSCGACCAAFRVAFHWSEAQPHKPDGVPAELATPLRLHELAMHGTLTRPVRCVALVGEVGGRSHCTIYAARPAPCRELGAAWEHGAASPQCDRARALHGLAPLTLDDWRT